MVNAHVTAGALGERKQVTVLSATLDGLAELTFGLDIEEGERIVEGALESIARVIRRYEGTMSEIADDGLLAIFGVPVALEDHAVRACYAGHAIHQAVAGFRPDSRADLKVRVGLASGEVLVRTMTTRGDAEYLVTGEPRTAAAQLAQTASPGMTLISAETRTLAEGFVRVSTLVAPSADDPTVISEVFELVGASSVHTGLQALGARRVTPLVGRQDELAILENALEHAKAGEGRIIALVGEPGSGKSRLLWEVTRTRRDEWLVLEASATSHPSTSPYLAIADLLRAYVDVTATADSEEIKQKLSARIAAGDHGLTDAMPAFLTVLGLPGQSAEWDALDPPQRRQRVHEGIRRLLLTEAARQPVLLVIEDLHWVDAETQALLGRLVEIVFGARVALAVSYRPEYRHEWANLASYLQIRVASLSSEASGQLLDTLMGTDASVVPLKRRLVEQTAGNPFFLEEYVRQLADSGALLGGRGDYRLVGSLDEVHMPSTIQAVLAARIDRLPREQKQVLESAAVIGKDLPVSLLRAIVELAQDGLDQALAGLQSSEFLYERSIVPDSEFTFRHALIQNVAYETLLRSQRRELHGRIVRELEAQGRMDTSDEVGRLAQHAFAGELWEKAVSYSRVAATQAAQTAAYRTAITSLERALAALEHLPSTPDRARESIDIRLELRSAYAPLGELQSMHDHLRVALSEAEDLGDDERVARANSYLCTYYAVAHDPHRAVECGEKAFALASGLGLIGLQVLSASTLGETLYSLGDFRRGASLLKQNVDRLRGDLLSRRFGMTGMPAVVARGLLTLCLAELGEFEQGSEVATSAVQLAEALSSPYSLSSAYSDEGFLYLMKGDFERALRSLVRAVELCRTWDFPLRLVGASARLGYARVLAGELDMGTELLEQAVQGPRLSTDCTSRHQWSHGSAMLS
jgi:class 3 adenylate cyclase/tetratricopeptide (TPR) repeat protein